VQLLSALEALDLVTYTVGDVLCSELSIDLPERARAFRGGSAATIRTIRADTGKQLKTATTFRWPGWRAVNRVELQRALEADGHASHGYLLVAWDTDTQKKSGL
jgi:hypothetical protein